MLAMKMILCIVFLSWRVLSVSNCFFNLSNFVGSAGKPMNFFSKISTWNFSFSFRSNAVEEAEIQLKFMKPPPSKEERDACFANVYRKSSCPRLKSPSSTIPFWDYPWKEERIFGSELFGTMPKSLNLIVPYTTTINTMLREVAINGYVITPNQIDKKKIPKAFLYVNDVFTRSPFFIFTFNLSEFGSDFGKMQNEFATISGDFYHPYCQDPNASWAQLQLGDDDNLYFDLFLKSPSIEPHE